VKRRPEFGWWGVACLAVLGVVGPSRLALAADEESAESSDESEGSKKASSDGDAEKDAKKDAEKADDEKPAKDEAFGHGNQIGARIGIVGGYRMILRYDDSQPCAKIDLSKSEQQKFCGHASPFAITPALSFGIADWLEPYAWARLGLSEEEETYTDPVVMFGAGVRVYTMSDAPFKIFIEPGIGLELEDSNTGADLKTDVAFHLAAGPTLDFNRYIGAYLTAGVTTTVLRFLATSLDVELGIQGRY
jgi:opacity protein-like surface antigen